MKSFTKLAGAAALLLPIIGLSAQSAMAEDLQFAVNNYSSASVQSFYLSPSESDDWGNNILQGSLGSNQQGVTSVRDGLSVCEYDILAEFSDGSTLEDYSVDICDLGEYNIYDE